MTSIKKLFKTKRSVEKREQSYRIYDIGNGFNIIKEAKVVGISRSILTKMVDGKRVYQTEFTSDEVLII